jgi:hypothetical protein
MTNDERIQAVIDCGFTDRQARFLVLVMLHAGVCVPRQYAEFAGIANGGRRCNLFFDRLVARAFAHEIRCAHNRARVYHLRHKHLYGLIGEDARHHRRPVSPLLAVQRLMLLDALLTMPDVAWLTEVERPGYLERLMGAAAADARADAPLGATADKASASRSGVSVAFPIGVASHGRTVLVYLASEPSTDRFRTFLQTNRKLLRAAPGWTLRLIFPRPLHHIYATYLTVIRQEVQVPVEAASIREAQRHVARSLEDADERRQPGHEDSPRNGSTASLTSRSVVVVGQEMGHRNTATIGSSLPVFTEALNLGPGRVEAVELRHSYRHLFPVIAETPARPQPMDTGLRRGPARGPATSRVLNPRPQPPSESPALTLQEQMDLEWRRLARVQNVQRAHGLTARRAVTARGGDLCRPR